MARMRTARVLALLGGTFACTLVACSVLTGLDADYKLQTNEQSVEAGKDGDVEQDGPTGSDAKADTDVLPDGGKDATVDAFTCPSDAGPTGWCWDFEKNTVGMPNFGWENYEATLGSYDVVAGAGVDKSKGLVAKLSAPIASSGQAFLTQTIPGGKFTSFRKHSLSFSYRIVKGTTLYTASLGAIGFGGSGNQYIGASIYGSPSLKGVVDLSDPPGGALGVSDTVEIGTWKRVKIDIDRAGMSGTYTSKLAIDGTDVQESPPPFNAGASTAPTQVWVGAFFSAMGDGGVEVVIDNVMVSQEP